jgi:hypothetical protein
MKAAHGVADYWPHNRVNQRVTFDEPGVKADKVSVNKKVMGGSKLR